MKTPNCLHLSYEFSPEQTLHILPIWRVLKNPIWRRENLYCQINSEFKSIFLHTYFFEIYFGLNDIINFKKNCKNTKSENVKTEC